MVEHLEKYKELLRRGATVLEQLLTLYAPDKRTENDWADISLADTRNQYRSFMERLLNPPTKMTAEETSPLALSIRHYIDSHWADYRELPVADAKKRTQVEELHTQLEAVADGIGQIYNAVRKS